MAKLRPIASKLNGGSAAFLRFLTEAPSRPRAEHRPVERCQLAASSEHPGNDPMPLAQTRGAMTSAEPLNVSLFRDPRTVPLQLGGAPAIAPFSLGILFLVHFLDDPLAWPFASGRLVMVRIYIALSRHDSVSLLSFWYASVPALGSGGANSLTKGCSP